MASAGGGRGRGGFGGGRGGRGGRGGGSSGGVHALPMGALTWNDFSEADKAKPNRHAYPPMEEQPIVRKPNESETRMIARQLAFVEAQRQTPWWIRPLDQNAQFKQQSTTTNISANSVPGGTGLSIASAGAGVKRSSAFLPRYSDKFRRINGLSKGEDVEQAQPSSTDLDTLTLQDEALLNMLQKEAFPNGLWRTYVEGENKRHEKRQEAVANAKKRRSDWRKIVTGVELAGNDDISDGAHSEDDVGEDAYQDEYEDDVEDDYADNYFDNGEDDDLPDEAGAGEADDVYD